MSQTRQEQEDNQSDEKCQQELDAAEKELETNADITDFSLLDGPQTSTAEQTLKTESWLWGWFPFPFLSGLTWLGDRNKSLQEPVCCQVQREKTSSNMCPACEILFCKKCETLHYSRVFIEHGLLGHSTEILPEALSPTMSTGSIDLVGAPVEAENRETKWP
ncbi:uncharacterized protein C17orf50 homolog [Erythrolamprus reginae]|uniref:uncharacterized protein C17orf50 homolog n=1 Tax=Erythrolamprus reginae TaxID=121349 RepID=UPI00396C9574